MAVKPGYKQTEVGVIPEDWQIRQLKDCCQKLNVSFVGTCEPFYTSRATGVLMLRTGNLQGDKIILDDVKYVTKEFHARNRKSQVRAGDILIARHGNSGNAVPVPPEIDDVNALSIVILRTDNRVLDSQFASHCINSGAVRSQAAEMLAGSTQVIINTKEVAKLQLPLPAVAEQRAIATALSDVDALLGGLNRLIVKKRDLKQAAMQQLLTGQTRLPGFHGEWKVKGLKQVAEIATGINKPLSEMGSGALYVTVQDLYDGTSIRTNGLSRIKVSEAEMVSKALAAGDIVFGKSSVKREGIGYPSQFAGCDEPVVFSGFTYRARARPGISDATFLFYALRAEKTRRWLIDNSQASALTNINQSIADAIPIKLPPKVFEQTAIAEVLADMDAELVGLEGRREKTRALKQAMMQELLTGRTRLV